MDGGGGWSRGPPSCSLSSLPTFTFFKREGGGREKRRLDGNLILLMLARPAAAADGSEGGRSVGARPDSLSLLTPLRQVPPQLASSIKCRIHQLTYRTVLRYVASYIYSTASRQEELS